MRPRMESVGRRSRRSSIGGVSGSGEREVYPTPAPHYPPALRPLVLVLMLMLAGGARLTDRSDVPAAAAESAGLVRGGECGEQEFDELAVPHSLLGLFGSDIGDLEAGQDQLAGA